MSQQFAKNISVEIVKSQSSEYDATFVMSASSPDRMSDTIEPSAYKSNLGKKLIALYQHDANNPIGYWNNLRIEADKLIGDLKVASTNLGQMIKQLISDGVPMGASIGFRGTGEPNKIGGINFKTIELMECSVVSIPAHPRAMQVAKSFQLESLIEQSSLDGDATGDSGPDSQLVIKHAKAAILAANRTLRKKYVNR
jgi:HK97 family phage prohead protease